MCKHAKREKEDMHKIMCRRSRHIRKGCWAVRHSQQMASSRFSSSFLLEQLLLQQILGALLLELMALQHVNG